MLDVYALAVRLSLESLGVWMSGIGRHSDVCDIDYRVLAVIEFLNEMSNGYVLSDDALNIISLVLKKLSKVSRRLRTVPQLMTWGTRHRIRRRARPRGILRCTERQSGERYSAPSLLQEKAEPHRDSSVRVMGAAYDYSASPSIAVIMLCTTANLVD